ncbi:MAG: 50S ribosomal protein L25 [Chloroflexota bacterium]|nr:50S ribosomal protein L25 [Chloroflexota bacterium]
MPERPELTAHHREVTGKKVARLRREGIVPAVLYGHGQPSEPVQVDARAFEQLRRHVGRNALIDLHVENGRPRPVLVHAVQEHPVNRRVVHVDFFLVSMREELTVDVPIAMTGSSEAVEKQGGTLLHLLDTVKVRALPADLPDLLQLDVTPLRSFEEVLHVRDLSVPESVTLLTDPDEPIARVQPPRIEEEVVAAAGVEGAEAAGAEPGAPTETGEAPAEKTAERT